MNKEYPYLRKFSLETGIPENILVEAYKIEKSV